MLFTRISLPLVVYVLPFSATAAILKELTGGIVPENEDGSLPLFQLGPASAAIPSAALNARAVPAEHGRPAPDGCAAPARRPAPSNEETPTPSPDLDSVDDLAAIARPTETRGPAGARRPRPTPLDGSASTSPHPERPTPVDDDSDVADSEAPEPTKTQECSDAGGGFLDGILDPVSGGGRRCGERN